MRQKIHQAIKFIFMVLLIQGQGFAQSPAPYYFEFGPLPEPVTNNAVTAAKVNDTVYVYSFMGLDSSKLWSGIHLKSWRLNTLTDEWQPIAPVPDPSGGLIAAAASTVKNKIYVIGGYHVAQNGNETSSNRVHRFDPQTNAWLPDGANIPKAIDDHVQAVWRDSLIFVVTGWSNTSNVANVQIYNPATDTWLAGTSVPNNNDYKVFGASGIIKGDTLYYIGGASNASNFPATSVFRKGHINPNNPVEITWSAETSPAAKGYRMAAATMADHLVWLGGADVTYNYNGIAYNGSGGVPALARVKAYHKFFGGLSELSAPGLFPNIMDLRGAAQINQDFFVTVGGMGSQQKVSNRVYGYSWQYTVPTTIPLNASGIKISPNPASDYLSIESSQALLYQLLDTQGSVVRQAFGSGRLVMETHNLPRGYYWLRALQDGNLLGIEKIVLAR